MGIEIIFFNQREWFGQGYSVVVCGQVYSGVMVCGQGYSGVMVCRQGYSVAGMQTVLQC